MKNAYWQRARSSGAGELVLMTALFSGVVAGHASGWLGPPRAGSTVERMMNSHGISFSLVALMLAGAAVLMHCKPGLLHIYTLFFAGILAGLGLASIMFFDAWLGALLFGTAAMLFRKGSAGVLARQSL